MDEFSENMTVEKAWDLLRKTQYLSDLDWDVEFPESSESGIAQKTSAFAKEKEKPTTSDEGCLSHSLQPDTCHHLVQGEASSSSETDTARNSASVMESGESTAFEMRSDNPETSYAGCSSSSLHCDIFDPLVERKTFTSDETDTRRSCAPVMQSEVFINHINIVVKEEPECIEVKDEPISPPSSDMSYDEAVANEIHDGYIRESGLCHVKKGESSEEGGKSPVDPLPVSGTGMPQLEIYPNVEAAVSGNETRVSAMKKEVEINSFVSFRSEALPQLSPGTESGSYIAETQRPIMTQMDSTKEFNRGTSCLDIASSSQLPLSDAKETSTQDHSPVLLQNLHSQTSFVMASCFTAAGGYLLERKDEDQVAEERQRQEEEQIAGEKQMHEEEQAAGVRQKTHGGQNGREKSVSIAVSLPERKMQTSASLRCSYEESVRESKGNAFDCSTCGMHFPLKFQLDKHMRKHRNERPYKCSYCGKSFNHKSNLTLHMRLHTGEKPYKCNQCEKTFNKKPNLNVHMRIHTGETPFQCSQCEKSFSQKAHLITHKRVHTGEKPYNCRLCQKTFNQKQTLTVHMRLHTGEKPYKCNQCEKTFNKKPNLNVHMRIHTGEKPFQCSQCEKSFSRKPQLTAHKRVHTGEKPYNCRLCQKTFNQKQTLTMHMRLHTGEKPYKCNQCEKTFNNKPNLTRHMGTHTGEKPFQCSQCKKSFSQKNSLTAHICLHTGETPYTCSQCEKSFSQKPILTAHMRLHTGEKPYTCSQCEKTFNHKPNLTRHMRVHTGEKPFQCSQCEKSFSQKRNLTAHMCLHTGEKPYTCSQCEKSFRQKPHLTAHMRLHTGEKTYICSQCEKTFRYRSGLSRHMGTHK